MGSRLPSPELDYQKTKHLEFKMKELKTKTAVYNVVAKGCVIAEIKYYPGWRRYCFFPKPSTLYDENCLTEIKEFIKKLMLDRKVRIQSEKN